MKGYVIGVNTAGLDIGNLNFAVAIDNIKDWLSELEFKSFDEITAVDVAKQKEAEKDADSNQVRIFIENMFKALNTEDINACKTAFRKSETAD